MKILHTSDLHVGKKLMGRDRSGEYRAVFAELCAVCEKYGVELALIAGDIFDTYTPSAESEEIFYNGVKALSEHCAVMIISGNHDDYVRLTAAAALAEQHNVYITGNNLRPVTVGKRGKTYPVKSGCGWVIFENSAGERVYINALPYPNEARFKEGKTDESFADKMSRWISCGEEGREQGVPAIFLSHLFVAGGQASDSEREIDLGGARVVPVALLPECDYCALGHLHKRQEIGKNIHYSGAPMQFSFDECGAEKSVNVFELTADGVKNFVRIPVNSTRKLVRLQAENVADAVSALTANSQYFAELTLYADKPMTSQESTALHSLENLVSLKVEIKGGTEFIPKTANANKSSSTLFKEYYKLRYGSDAPDGLLALFLALAEEE